MIFLSLLIHKTNYLNFYRVIKLQPRIYELSKRPIISSELLGFCFILVLKIDFYFISVYPSCSDCGVIQYDFLNLLGAERLILLCWNIKTSQDNVLCCDLKIFIVFKFLIPVLSQDNVAERFWFHWLETYQYLIFLLVLISNSCFLQ
jgi:hypothetical protein